jgi:hypothetical protein
MGISPWPVGQLTAIQIPLAQESKQVDLTGQLNSNISVVIYSVAVSTTTGLPVYTLVGTSTGACSVVQNKPGIIQWSPASGDVATAGTYALRVKVNFNGTTPQIFDYVPWTIEV